MTKLEKISQGHYLLKGQLNFGSVPELWLTTKGQTAKGLTNNKEENHISLFADDSNTLDIDLSQLERSDSSGLALLVEWYREAEYCNKRITFFNLPAQMYAIARVSGLDEILPLARK